MAAAHICAPSRSRPGCGAFVPPHKVCRVPAWPGLIPALGCPPEPGARCHRIPVSGAVAWPPARWVHPGRPRCGVPSGPVPQPAALVCRLSPSQKGLSGAALFPARRSQGAGCAPHPGLKTTGGCCERLPWRNSAASREPVGNGDGAPQDRDHPAGCGQDPQSPGLTPRVGAAPRGGGQAGPGGAPSAGRRCHGVGGGLQGAAGPSRGVRGWWVGLAWASLGLWGRAVLACSFQDPTCRHPRGSAGAGVAQPCRCRGPWQGPGHLFPQKNGVSGGGCRTCNRSGAFPA